MPVAKGTRDFVPEMVRKRDFLFSIIKNAFEKSGFQPIETPSFELSETLMGKYGEEGDQLIFRILNSGNFLENVKNNDLQELHLLKIRNRISEKALRYDLTIPFARFVSEHRSEIQLPFKRYQIQPVWRADRPQKGRYREFTQCDADIIGTQSLHAEFELIMLIEEVFEKLKLPVVIQLNHRLLLEGILSSINKEEKLREFSVIIDKIDKIGIDAVSNQLQDIGLNTTEVSKIKSLFQHKLSFVEITSLVQSKFDNNLKIERSLNELDKILSLFNQYSNKKFAQVFITPSLARGLNYYTGTIIEIKSDKGEFTSSIGGGGRYDNLTELFGWKGVSGVGISFGADRIIDVMNELDLFPKSLSRTTKIMVVNSEYVFTQKNDSTFSVYSLVKRLRKKGVSVEIYPEQTKLKKQLDYANKRNIPFVIIYDENEFNLGIISIKDMVKCQQHSISVTQALAGISNIIKHVK